MAIASHPSRHCPEGKLLNMYRAGELDSLSREKIEQHLLVCTDCCERADSIAINDTIEDCLRSWATGGGEFHDDSETNQIIDKVLHASLAQVETSISPNPSETTEISRQPIFGAGDPASSTTQPTTNLEIRKEDGDADVRGHGGLAVGTVFGGYRIDRILGRGGMGVVYEAMDERLGRTVAIKVMRADIARKDSARERFLREARAAAAIDHPNVVAIFQVGEENGIPFIAMPRLQGETLRQLLRREEKLDPHRVIDICRQLLQGLAAAHAVGLVHRDLKPDNIWMIKDSRRVAILDFGLAQQLEQDSQLTQSGTILGTPSYMSPEQAFGDKVDGRSDLFSVGVIVYQMLSGRLPFEGKSMAAILIAVTQKTPASLLDIVPGLDRNLHELVQRMLSKAPDQRPASATELLDSLDQWDTSVKTKHDTSIVAAPSVEAYGASGRIRRGWLVALAMFMAAVLAAGLVIKVRLGKHDVQIAINDPNVSLRVDNENLVFERNGQVELQLKSGLHGLAIEKDGLTVLATAFMVSDKGQTEIFVEATEHGTKVLRKSPDDAEPIMIASTTVLDPKATAVDKVAIAKSSGSPHTNPANRQESKMDAVSHEQAGDESLPKQTDIELAKRVLNAGAQLLVRGSQPIVRAEQIPEESLVVTGIMLMTGHKVSEQDMRLLIAEPTFIDLYVDTKTISDEVLAAFKSQQKNSMERIMVRRTLITPAFAELLASQVRIDALDIFANPEQDYAFLKNIKMQRLGVIDSNFTDNDIMYLLNQHELIYLNLSNSKITSKALPQLAKLTQLRELILEWVDLQEDEVRELSAALPRCKIAFTNETGTLTLPD
jgi:serine/threonine protein kinase